MSWTCMVHEHLKVNNVDTQVTETKAETVSFLRHRMVALGALMLQDRAINVMIKANINGNEIRYENDDAGKDYKELIAAMEDIENVDIVLDYCYDGGNGISFWDELDPSEMMEFLEKKSKKEKEDIFYSVWNYEYEGDWNGKLFAYGEKDGKYYNGEVEYVRINEYPDGQWYSIDDMGIEINQLSSENTKKLKEICLNLEKHTYNDEPAEQAIRMVNDDFEYYFRNVIMKSKEEVAEVVTMIRDVIRMTKDIKTDYFYYAGAYVDDGDVSDERLMRIEFDSDLNPVISIAQI